jgi:nucleoside 2-deoxyribosyltransferase
MKYYFASRYHHREKLLKVADLLIAKKHKVVSSWLWVDSLRPYEENQKESRLMAARIEREIKNCDIFILISDKAGTDMFVEYGIAIALKKKIYIVGKWNKRSLMHFHPHITQIDSLKDIIKL